MNPSENPERDRAIFAMRERGKSFGHIGMQFELSVTRIRQIYFRELREREKQDDAAT